MVVGVGWGVRRENKTWGKGAHALNLNLKLVGLEGEDRVKSSVLMETEKLSDTNISPLGDRWGTGDDKLPFSKLSWEAIAASTTTARPSSFNITRLAW